MSSDKADSNRNLFVEVFMKTATMRLICRILMLSMFMLPFQQAVQAAMIGTEQVLSAGTAQGERQGVLSVVNRSEVASQLQSMGIDPKVARDRVAAMSDDEVRTLAGRIDALPAGAHTSGWAWAAAILIAVWIWYAWK
jgi:hypothetical protein